MAKPNYQYEKRQRELAKKAKKAEKAARKASGRPDEPEQPEGGIQPAEADTPVGGSASDPGDPGASRS